MKLSTRIQTLPDQGDNPWAIYEAAQALRAKGVAVTMLSIGDHDTITPDPIIDHMAQAAKRGNTGYATVPGMPPLRAAIAARAGCAPDNVFVTPGGQFALFACLMAMIDPGDRVVIIDPYYATYPITVRAAGGVVVTAKALPDHGFQPDFDDLDRALNGARVLLINSPNNPTGAVYPLATLHRIAALCQKHDVWLISDEVYNTQVWQGAHLSPRDLPDMAQRSAVIGTMSKSHVMTGFRLGWLIGPEALVSAAWELAIATTYGVPGFIQEAATFALTQGQQIEADTAARYRRRRDLAVEALHGANGLRVSAPQGAMYVMLDIRATGLSGIEFAHSLLEQHHIAVMPGEGFGSVAAGHLRVSLTLPDADLVRALHVLADHAAEMVQANHDA